MHATGGRTQECWGACPHRRRDAVSRPRREGAIDFVCRLHTQHRKYTWNYMHSLAVTILAIHCATTVTTSPFKLVAFQQFIISIKVHLRKQKVDVSRIFIKYRFNHLLVLFVNRSVQQRGGARSRDSQSLARTHTEISTASRQPYTIWR